MSTSDYELLIKDLACLDPTYVDGDRHLFGG
jgi:hypothetical protein